MFEAERFAEGLRLRLTACQAVVDGRSDGVAFARRKDSIGRDFILREFCGERQATRNSQKDLVFLSFVHDQPDIATQRRELDQLLEYCSSSYVQFMALGAYCGQRHELSASDIPSNIDYSIYIGSALASGALDARSEREAHLLVDRYHAQVRAVMNFGADISTFAGLRPLISQFYTGPQLPWFAQCAAFARVFQQKYWWLLGPDFAATLMVFCEGPSRHDAKTRARALEIASFFGLGQVAKDMNELGEIACRIGTSELGEGARSRVERHKAQLLSNRGIGPKLYADAARGLMQETWRLVDERSFAEANSNLVALAELDMSLLERMDWPYLAERLTPASSTPSITKAFVDHLFLRPGITPAIKRRFRLKWGPGVLMGSLTRILNERQRGRKWDQALPGFFARVRHELPRASAAEFIRFLLERPNVERLGPRYAEPVGTPDLESRRNREQMITPTVRVQMASLALRHRNITAEEFEEIIEEERQIVAILRFRAALNAGRIRLPLDWLREVANEHLSDLEMRLHDLALETDGAVDNDFLRAVCDTPLTAFFSEVIFVGRWAVDKLLSSNLRHGVLMGLYHSAFGDAVRSASHDAPATVSWGDATTRQMLGAAFSATDAAFYKPIMHAVESFIADFLIVTDDASLVVRCRTRVENLARQYAFEGRGVKSGGFLEEIANIVHEEAATFVDSARTAFLSTTNKSIMRLFEGARSRHNAEGNLGTQFLDALRGDLEATGEMAASWMQLPSESALYNDFKVTDLLSLELELIHRRTPAQVNFTSRCVEVVEKARRIAPETFVARGAMFEMLSEVVQNLVANAVNHSGLGLKCGFELEFVRRGDDLDIIASNSLSVEATRKAQATYKAARAAAEGVGKLRAADHSSGFQKIREACERGLNARPQISIIQPTVSAGYVVRVRFVSAARKILTDA